MNIGVILAGGDGSRFKSSVHKQYLKLNGKEVVYYAIDEMRLSGVFDKILVVVDEEEYQSKYLENKYKLECIKGGNTRNKSIKYALDYIKEHYEGTDKVIFHDAVRPFVKGEFFQEIIELLNEYDAVVTIKHIGDTLGDKRLKYVDRNDYDLIQAPEGFKFEKIYKYFDGDSKCTAMVNQVYDKVSVRTVVMKDFSLKINYPEDLFLAEQLMRVNYIKSGLIAKKMDMSKITGKVLLLGGTGGMGSSIKEKLEAANITYFAPTIDELDLSKASYQDFKNVCLSFNPDIIINTAAVSYSDSDGLIETFDKVISVNLLSNLYVIELAKELNKRVNIVFISSSSSTKGRQNITNYSASKAALNSVVESQAEVLHERNIYLNAIVPEKVNTPMIAKLHKQNIDTRELLPVDDVVNVILHYCVTDEYGKLVHVRKGL